MHSQSQLVIFSCIAVVDYYWKIVFLGKFQLSYKKLNLAAFVSVLLKIIKSGFPNCNNIRK